MSVPNTVKKENRQKLEAAIGRLMIEFASVCNEIRKSGTTPQEYGNSPGETGPTSFEFAEKELLWSIIPDNDHNILQLPSNDFLELGAAWKNFALSCATLNFESTNNDPSTELSWFDYWDYIHILNDNGKHETVIHFSEEMLNVIGDDYSYYDEDCLEGLKTILAHSYNHVGKTDLANKTAIAIISIAQKRLLEEHRSVNQEDLIKYYDIKEALEILSNNTQQKTLAQAEPSLSKP